MSLYSHPKNVVSRLAEDIEHGWSRFHKSNGRSGTCQRRSRKHTSMKKKDNRWHYVVLNLTLRRKRDHQAAIKLRADRRRGME